MVVSLDFESAVELPSAEKEQKDATEDSVSPKCPQIVCESH